MPLTKLMRTTKGHKIEQSEQSRNGTNQQNEDSKTPSSLDLASHELRFRKRMALRAGQHVALQERVMKTSANDSSPTSRTTVGTTPTESPTSDSARNDSVQPEVDTAALKTSLFPLIGSESGRTSLYSQPETGSIKMSLASQETGSTKTSLYSPLDNGDAKTTSGKYSLFPSPIDYSTMQKRTIRKTETFKRQSGETGDEAA
ncbi:hypothetical protein K461DRAFT_310967 [Myriangium duriaei CBS 260.36]|uniref:Uncharacterized protein n=1 Tax=Myriangium duriaei CBS 260.36 TaxID=1168546 RepID=A0A9P4MIS7_9PEZI|nr:hypothetical protein K461DRAFT_310967 [Myriangium duriaei CBS 260.36]